MNNQCQLVVFSDKAYNSIIRETFEWDPLETGGILLGHVLDNGCWIVMETLPPGYGEQHEGDRVFHEFGYFEYNRKFVNYLARSVAGQYEIPLELLGLWHRHPGSFDHFSGTDDETNLAFAKQNPHGTISGLVNIDPQLRMTMYYLSHKEGLGCQSAHPHYQLVDIEVGSDLIPEKYNKLRYYKGEEKDLHPYSPRCQGENRTNYDSEGENIALERVTSLHRESFYTEIEKWKDFYYKNKKFIILVLAIIAFGVSILSAKSALERVCGFGKVENTIICPHSKQSTLKEK